MRLRRTRPTRMISAAGSTRRAAPGSGTSGSGPFFRRLRGDLVRWACLRARTVPGSLMADCSAAAVPISAVQTASLSDAVRRLELTRRGPGAGPDAQRVRRLNAWFAENASATYPPLTAYIHDHLSLLVGGAEW